MLFFLCFPAVLPLRVLNFYAEAANYTHPTTEDHRNRITLNTSIHYTVHIHTPVVLFVFCFALFPIQGLCQFGPRTQPVNTKTDYQRLRKALIKEFADPESDQGLVAALETRQGRHEPPQAYYSRLRQAYFGTRNDSDMEDELNFKTLFLRNLHPGISHHLGVLACPRTMNTQQLRDLVQKVYYKQKMASEKSAKTPAVLDFNTQHHELALEGTQRKDSAKPPHKEWNAPPSNRE